jgi:hypothetical protein
MHQCLIIFDFVFSKRSVHFVGLYTMQYTVVLTASTNYIAALLAIHNNITAGY